MDKSIMSLKKSRDHILIYVILLIAFAGTLLKSIRPPNDWAEGHWLMTYDLGFIKRALPGTLFNLLNVYNTPESAENAIAIIGYLWFSIFILALFWVVSRILKRTDWQIPFIFYVILFATSGFIVMTGHVMGWFDHIFHLGTIGIIALILRKQLIPAVSLLCVLVFVHESVMIVGFPVILLAFIFTHKLYSWKTLLFITLPIVSLLVLIIHQETFDNHALYNSIVSYLENYPFVIDPKNILLPNAFTTDFSLYFKTQSPYLPQRLIHSVLSLRAYPFIGITLMLLGYSIWSCINNWRFVFIIACIFVPHTLHLVAWDYQRIWTYTILNAFLVAWVCVEVYKPNQIPAPQITIAFILTLMINIYGATPLMDVTEGIELDVIRTPLLIIILCGLILIKPIKTFIFVYGFASGNLNPTNSEENVSIVVEETGGEKTHPVESIRQI